jgi:hypothetical protein
MNADAGGSMSHSFTIGNHFDQVSGITAVFISSEFRRIPSSNLETLATAALVPLPQRFNDSG